MCQLGILLRRQFLGPAAYRVVPALSQFVDSLDISTFERVRMDSVTLDSSNQVRTAALSFTLNLQSVPDRDETVVLKFHALN
jgi:hypothetical protein